MSHGEIPPFSDTTSCAWNRPSAAKQICQHPKVDREAEATQQPAREAIHPSDYSNLYIEK